MAALLRCLVLLAVIADALAFIAPAAGIVAQRTPVLRAEASDDKPQAAAPASKGFGAPAKKVKKEKTAAQIEREKAASAYDNLAASGIPEYNIFVKVKVSLAGNLLRKAAHLSSLHSKRKLKAQSTQDAASNAFARDEGSGDDDWIPAGTMAVPRTEKVANAVFEQEEALMKGVLRLFPKLKDAELEYGHNLKMYPDEPVKVLVPQAKSEDVIKNWFEGLLSPLNTSDKK
eukprot:16963-Heterococcus_DN1.PRE.3